MLVVCYTYIADLCIAVVECMGSAVGGRSTVDCMPASNNPILLRTCTLESLNTETELSVNIPCMFKTSVLIYLGGYRGQDKSLSF